MECDFSYWILIMRSQSNHLIANILKSKKKKKHKKWIKTIISKDNLLNHLGGGPIIRAWDQEDCFLCGFMFELCGCSYDDH